MNRQNMLDPEGSNYNYNNQNNYSNDFEGNHEDPWYSASPKASNANNNNNMNSSPSPQKPFQNFNSMPYQNFNQAPSETNYNNYNNSMNFDNSGVNYNMNSSFEDEDPLLEELGINIEHIIFKSKAVIDPFKVKTHLLSLAIFILLFINANKLF